MSGNWFRPPAWGSLLCFCCVVLFYPLLICWEPGWGWLSVGPCPGRTTWAPQSLSWMTNCSPWVTLAASSGVWNKKTKSITFYPKLEANRIAKQWRAPKQKSLIIHAALWNVPDLPPKLNLARTCLFCLLWYFQGSLTHTGHSQGRSELCLPWHWIQSCALG